MRSCSGLFLHELHTHAHTHARMHARIHANKCLARTCANSRARFTHTYTTRTFSCRVAPPPHSHLFPSSTLLNFPAPISPPPPPLSYFTPTQQHHLHSHNIYIKVTSTSTHPANTIEGWRPSCVKLEKVWVGHH